MGLSNASQERSHALSRYLLSGAMLFTVLTICAAVVSWATVRRVAQLGDAPVVAELPEAREEAVPPPATSVPDELESNLEKELASLKKKLKSSELRVKAEVTAREGLRKKLLETQQALSKAQAEIKKLSAAQKAAPKPEAPAAEASQTVSPQIPSETAPAPAVPETAPKVSGTTETTVLPTSDEAVPGSETAPRETPVDAPADVTPAPEPPPSQENAPVEQPTGETPAPAPPVKPDATDSPSTQAPSEDATQP